MVEFLKKQDSELPDLGFKTTAAWITDLLKEIRRKNSGEDKESLKMDKKLRYAIEKLNSRGSLFAIDRDAAKISDDEEPE